MPVWSWENFLRMGDSSMSFNRVNCFDVKDFEFFAFALSESLESR